MEITTADIQKKIEDAQKDLIAYGTKAQNEINAMQRELQEKVRAAQQYVDKQEGKIAALLELQSQIQSQPAFISAQTDSPLVATPDAPPETPAS